jgi:hypothetical protein
MFACFCELRAIKAVQQEDVIDIADHCGLRRAVGPIRSNCHDAVLVEQPNDEVLEVCQTATPYGNTPMEYDHRFWFDLDQ